MPRRANWMEPVDVAVLEALADREDPADPGDLAADVDASEADVERRCEELSVQGLIQPVTHDGYVLRPLGEDYLAGEVPPRLLDAPGE